ncbi:MAG: hypothetical protein ACREQD_11990, partial [Candidatus Binataceae bacterium]
MQTDTARSRRAQVCRPVRIQSRRLTFYGERETSRLPHMIDKLITAISAWIVALIAGLGYGGVLLLM